MSIWNKIQIAKPPSESLEEKNMLETIKELIRIAGKYAFDVEGMTRDSIHQKCEQWIRHLSLTPDESDITKTRRNWTGLKSFLTQIRIKESTYVNVQLENTKQVVGDFLQSLSMMLVDNQSERETILSIVDSIRKSIVSNTRHDSLSQEVNDALDRINHIIHERNQRQERVVDSLSKNLSNLRSELDVVKKQSETDGLTQIFNRRSLDDYLLRICKINRVSSMPATLLMIDIDHFKVINDTHGHPVGDIVLKKLSECLLRTFHRKSDFVSRYGGEEFAVVVQETSLSDVLKLSERLMREIRGMRIALEDTMVDITVSIGISEFDPSFSIRQWVTQADNRLYSAKRLGRNRVEYLDS